MTRRDLPTGTVTMLFTDVEGSTVLLRELGEAAYADALDEHRRILRHAIAAHAGIEVDTEGDAIFAAFPTAAGAVTAAGECQATFATGPVRVRMGIHTGTPLRTTEGYVGVDVHRAARIAAAGHGGQVLLSSTTVALLDGHGVPMTDLGVHRLKDLEAGEHIHQLGTDPHPRLRSLSPSNLPDIPGGFVGRQAELLEIGELLRDASVPLLTLVGPGGIGKTRLAVEAAAAVAGSFPDGRWWVPLASVSRPEDAISAVAVALGLPDGSGGDAIGAHLAGRRTLVIVDNVEHLLPDLAAMLAPVTSPAGTSTILATGREPLRVQAERVVRVAEMTADDAEELLVSRAGALGITLRPSDELRALAERLDRLPLALSLAASRLSVLSVEQVLERLSQRLDLFAGSRDADPRQQTLRATIEWSHDLLTDAERTLVRRLSVFAGGWTLEAAEAVAAAELEVLQGLVDRSMVQRSDGAPPRFSMHESIRAFATEQLAASGEGADVRVRHAAWMRELVERVDGKLRSGEPEEQWIARLNPELDNMRAAVESSVEAGDAPTVRSIAAGAATFWQMHGRAAEGRAWIDRALEMDAAEDATRQRLLSGLAVLAYLQGDFPVAVEAADAAAALASQLGPSVDRSTVVRAQIGAAMARDDFATAEPLYEELLVLARADDNGVRTSACRINLAFIANRTGRHERAEELMAENLPFVRSRGQARCEASTLVALAETMTYLDRPTEAIEYAVVGAEVAPRAADPLLVVEDLRWYAAATTRLGQAEEAAVLLGACEAAEAELEVALEPFEVELRERLVSSLRDALPDATLEEARARGRQLDLEAASAFVRRSQPNHASATSSA